MPIITVRLAVKGASELYITAIKEVTPVPGMVIVFPVTTQTGESVGFLVEVEPRAEMNWASDGLTIWVRPTLAQQEALMKNRDQIVKLLLDAGWRFTEEPPPEP